MNPFCILVAGALLLTTSGSPAATFDVLSIYVNTDSTDDVSARFDFTDRDGSPGFEFFESMTLIRPNRLDVFTISDVNLFLPGVFRTDPDPNRLHSPGFQLIKNYTD